MLETENFTDKHQEVTKKIITNIKIIKMAYNKTPFKMYGKSPMMKALVGKQGNLPMHLQEKIKAAPESPAKNMDTSPVKQTDTKIKDIPEVLENTGKKVLEKGKKVIKDIGNITLSSKERKACKEKGGRFKKGKCYMPESPAKKKGCKYGKSPAKQKFIPDGTPKSKKEMKYDKTAQKAENAAVEGKVRKNSRLVNRANKMNKKNNLGKGKIAKM